MDAFGEDGMMMLGDMSGLDLAGLIESGSAVPPLPAAGKKTKSELSVSHMLASPSVLLDLEHLEGLGSPLLVSESQGRSLPAQAAAAETDVRHALEQPPARAHSSVPSLDGDMSGLYFASPCASPAAAADAASSFAAMEEGEHGEMCSSSDEDEDDDGDGDGDGDDDEPGSDDGDSSSNYDPSGRPRRRPQQQQRRRSVAVPPQRRLEEQMCRASQQAAALVARQLGQGQPPLSATAAPFVATNNKRALDAKWPEELLTMEQNAFRSLCRNTTMSKPELRELKAARRRAKNREYAKASRARRLDKERQQKDANSVARSEYEALRRQCKDMRTTNGRLQRQARELVAFLAKTSRVDMASLYDIAPELLAASQ